MHEYKAVFVGMCAWVCAWVCYIDAFLEKGARISPIQRDTSALLFIIEAKF